MNIGIWVKPVQSRLIIIAALLGVAPLAGAADPLISNLLVTPDNENRQVVVTYRLDDPDSATVLVSMAVSTDAGSTYTIQPVTFENGSDVGAVAPGSNKRIVWLAGTDWPEQATTQMKIRLIADDTPVPPGMVLIPEGEFAMGNCMEPDEGNPDELPAHTVFVSAFCMDKTEVTKALWDEVRTWAETNGYAFYSDYAGQAEETNHPVYQVPWSDAVKWCNARSEREGLSPCYATNGTIYRTDTSGELPSDEVTCDWSANGYRLPTEAEWEKAARGGVAGHRFPWADSDEIQHARATYFSSSDYDYDTSPTPDYHPLYPPIEVCEEWDPIFGFCIGKVYYYNNGPVGAFLPNGYGLYDMAGSLAEWCWDRYAADYYSEVASQNPSGPQQGTERVIRGGGYSSDAIYLRCAARQSCPPTWDPLWTGFRCVRSSATPPATNGAYMVIDLSGGPDATNYPVSYLNAVPAGGWGDEYKTTKLVLRKIPHGTFTMGSPTNEVGREIDETQHQVTLTKDFYIGVFEVTQKQWERVMGNWPSYFTNASYRETRPVERVSYYEIRENPANNAISSNWPQSDQVHADSFMGKLRAKTGLSTFDLPTEAQWEYACRAGTTTAINSGYNLTNVHADARAAEVGRYFYNHPGGYSGSSSVSTDGGTAKVGCYLPNPWGLYDMHGNVWEWCLDWYGSYPDTVSDPKGAVSGSGRVLRGCGYHNEAYGCRSPDRFSLEPFSRGFEPGFRPARTLP